MRAVPLRHVAEIRSSSVDKKSRANEQPVRLCNYMDVYRNDRVHPGLDLMAATATPEEIARFHLEAGDSIITKDSEDPSDIGVSAYVDSTDDRFVCGYHLAIIRPASEAYPRYLNWSLRSREVLGHWSNHAAGMTRYGLGLEGIKSAPVHLPDFSSQRRIAGFLDDRVDRIDRIIAARREQITLVAEAAEAELEQLIVAPGAELRPLSALTDAQRPIQYGIVLPGPHFEGGVPIIKGGDIGSGRLERLELACTDPTIEAGYRRSRVRPGDWVIAIRGSVGEVSAVPPELALANLTQDSARIAPHDCDGEWLGAVLRCSSVQARIGERVTGSTVKGINIGDLRRVPVPVPSRDRQRSLGQTASRHHERSRAAAGWLARSIDLLTDFRASLITAAVSGELDVTTAGSGIPA